MKEQTQHEHRNGSHVAIVGAGPRGTSALERICASASLHLPPTHPLTIHILDPYPPGAGAVWRTRQSSQLLMNTVSSQVTLFTDNSVECPGPIKPGPSLHEWAKVFKPDLGPNEYPSRAQYGEYLEWVFGEICRRAPEQVTVETHAVRVTKLDDLPDGRQKLTMSNGETLPGLDAVILAQGHLPLRPSPLLQELTEHAAQHGLNHVQPRNPADADLSFVQPGEVMVLRGLGLNFFDYMALLTVGRGGKFTRASDDAGLVYHPSGKEPKMYAGSRRGIPYHARGDNAKGTDQRHYPLLIKENVIADFHQRIKAGDAPDFKTEIWPLISKEVQAVYYAALLGEDTSHRLDFQNKFLATPNDSAEEKRVLDDVGINEAERWSWDWIEKPQGDRVFETAEAWKAWLLPYLRSDVQQAKLDNVHGPLKAALDVLRDLRNEVRLIVDHDGLKGTSRRDDLDHWYTALNAYLSIGPPRERIEQMVALLESDTLNLLGPSISVTAEDDGWVAHSPEIPSQVIRAKTLIEARLPEINLRHSADPLLVHLFETGQCRAHKIDGYETGGIDVSVNPYRLINSDGEEHPRRFAIGVPTEGVHWVTAAGARPGVNSVTLVDTDAVAQASLKVAAEMISRAEDSSKLVEDVVMSEPFVSQRRGSAMNGLFDGLAAFPPDVDLAAIANDVRRDSVVSNASQQIQVAAA